MPLYSSLASRVSIGRQFPELLRTEDEDLQFVDSIDHLNEFDICIDGHSQAHYFD